MGCALRTKATCKGAFSHPLARAHSGTALLRTRSICSTSSHRGRSGGLWSECCRVPAARKATHLVTTELVRRHRVVKGPVGGKDVLKQGAHGVGKWSTCQGNVPWEGGLAVKGPCKVAVLMLAPRTALTRGGDRKHRTGREKTKPGEEQCTVDTSLFHPLGKESSAQAPKYSCLRAWTASAEAPHTNRGWGYLQHKLPLARTQRTNSGAGSWSGEQRTPRDTKGWFWTDKD